MSLLFRNLRVHQIFGANTDVGKTILTSALLRASTLKNINSGVFYLKPVSTGAPEDADDKHIKTYAGSRVQTECLFRYDEPVSPHLAAKMGNSSSTPPSDETFVNTIAAYIRRKAASANVGQNAHMYVETAGGVHSPTLSGTTQAEAYRPLFLPTVLVGDSKLGGISSTIASYEALLLRGYIIDAVLLFQDEYYRNFEYLNSYFAERSIQVAAVPPPPPVLSGSANISSTQKYYEDLVPSSSQVEKEQETTKMTISNIVDHLDICHAKRLAEIESMPSRALDTVWWPFVQHGLVKGEHDVTVIDSAHRDFFSIYRTPAETKPETPQRSGMEGESNSILAPEFDGSASWWTQTFGHASTTLTLAAARASGRYGHVMFPQAVHLPALRLAEHLVKKGPGKGWASRAFFSDDGSTGMEVALKMALRAFNLRSKHGKVGAEDEEFGVLGLKGSYHGDTMGVMDACEDSGVFTCEWHNAKGYWLEPPTVGIRDGKVVISVPEAISATTKLPAESLQWVYDVSARLDSPLADVYREFLTKTLKSLEARGKKGEGIPRLAALVLEPLVMGAGGMLFVDPLFHRLLIDVVRSGEVIGLPSPNKGTGEKDWSGLPVIFDEVFVGLHRLGMESTGPLLGALPDISVNAKILTGGLVPLSITMASKSIFDVFLGDGKESALLHGHSYTAHAVGCEVAGETLRVLDVMKTSKEWNDARGKWIERSEKDNGEERAGVWSFWDPGLVASLSKFDIVEETMALGCVLSVKVKDDSGGYASHSAQGVFGSLKDCLVEDTLSVAPGGAPYGIHFRTLGNVAYFMTSLNTPGEVMRSVEDRIWKTLNKGAEIKG